MNERSCPICGDPIPPTAHRLQKLCGKSSCMMEQQRISGRKSYHKLLGHTKPENRSCVVCASDITHLRSNRVVCENPECKKEIIRRVKIEHYERVHGTAANVQQRRVAQARYRAAHRQPRSCQVCHGDISHMPAGARICERQSCIDYRERLRATKGKKPSTRQAIKITKPQLPKPKKRPSSIRPAATASQKFIMPVLPKRKRHSTVDGAPASSKPINLPEADRIHYGFVSKEPIVFDDPWDCQACRVDAALCRLHAEMTAAGYRPRVIS